MKHLVRFDWAFERLLRNKANFGILEGFLSELLNEEVDIQTILESEGNRETGDNKANRVDLLVKNQQEELVIIEIQSNRVHDYLMRMLFGTSKLIVDNMDIGMGYNEIKKVISINVVYFDLGHGEDYIYRGCTTFTGSHNHDTLKLNSKEQQLYGAQEIADIYPEYYIIKVNNFNDIAVDSLDEWIYFLKNSEIREEFKAKGLQEANERLNILKLNDTERKEYDNYIAEWRAYNSLTVSNFEAGRIEGKYEVAHKCIMKGMSIEETSELTGLTVNQLQELLNKSGNSER